MYYTAKTISNSFNCFFISILPFETQLPREGRASDPWDPIIKREGLATHETQLSREGRASNPWDPITKRVKG